MCSSFDIAQSVSSWIVFSLLTLESCRGILRFTLLFVIETLAEDLRSINILKMYSVPSTFINLFSSIENLVSLGF